ncbi:hypothetical protein KPH14_007067 [Odynerus spinipes]|uniref:Glutathione S-transferase n=1 Tax=Odynerus spinipes TaxID=1348599 RepID=A0AAD9RT29_9HYME|nr:hypothetical protein KPH14_007067 [Odynerus spinipes]
MNPQGTVPLLQDRDYYVWDSHAISGYLVHEYGKSDILYPKDSKKRALVDQRLHFDTGTLYPEFRNIVYPVIGGEKIITKEKVDRVENAYKTLDSILANSKTKWLVGDEITIADLCNVSTMSTLELFIPTSGKYPHLENWLRSCKNEIPGYAEMNQRGLIKLIDYVKMLLTYTQGQLLYGKGFRADIVVRKSRLLLEWLVRSRLTLRFNNQWLLYLLDLKTLKQNLEDHANSDVTASALCNRCNQSIRKLRNSYRP